MRTLEREQYRVDGAIAAAVERFAQVLTFGNRLRGRWNSGCEASQSATAFAAMSRAPYREATASLLPQSFARTSLRTDSGSALAAWVAASVASPSRLVEQRNKEGRMR